MSGPSRPAERPGAGPGVQRPAWAGRIEHMHAGSFPSRERVEGRRRRAMGTAAGSVPGGPQDLRADQHSIEGFGSGRLGACWTGTREVEAIPVEWRAEIDPALARRMPEPTLAAVAGPLRANLPAVGKRSPSRAGVPAPVRGGGRVVAPAAQPRDRGAAARPRRMVRWNMACLDLGRGDACSARHRAREPRLHAAARGGRGTHRRCVRTGAWGPLEFEPGLLVVLTGDIDGKAGAEDGMKDLARPIRSRCYARTWRIPSSRPAPCRRRSIPRRPSSRPSSRRLPPGVALRRPGERAGRARRLCRLGDRRPAGRRGPRPGRAALRAFSNVCLHRMSTLLGAAAGSGRSSAPITPGPTTSTAPCAARRRCRGTRPSTARTTGCRSSAARSGWAGSS